MVIPLIKREISLLRNFIHEKLFFNPNIKQNAYYIKKFHKLFYDSAIKSYWFGHQSAKCPFDAWVYQEIIYEVKPDIIIESGTYKGGTSLYLAHLLDLIGKGKVITIDVKKRGNLPRHKRINYIVGSSTDEKTVKKVKSLFPNKKSKIMVLLDSLHTKEHVLKEMQIYSKFVSKGSYLIVEDTNINGNPVRPDFGPGPMEAVKEFLKINKNFVIDKKREKFYLTFNPQGYLKRIK